MNLDIFLVILGVLEVKKNKDLGMEKKLEIEKQKKI